MSARPVFFASDVHFGAAPPEQEAAFLRWLRYAGRQASAVVLNGDIFDFWFEYRRGVTRGYDELLAVLGDVVAGGVPVTLMGGNHDSWGGRHLRDEVGLELLFDPVVRTWAGYRTFLAHGDGLGPGDYGYKVMKRVLRSRFTRWSYGLLGPRLGDGIARRVSRTDERWEAPNEVDYRRSEAMEAWGVGHLRAHPELDLVVVGHTHIPVLTPVGEGRWYVNLGDWLRNRNYLALTQGEPPRLLDFDG